MTDGMVWASAKRTASKEFKGLAERDWNSA